ncbi:hypothetical protein [Marinomonas vulgaris]|nr:hypothetical protein [Marinomonas vulgaris]
MKIQLLMIIAVIVSSLLTISQRVHGQEVNQFRWLEPSVEQTFDKLTASDKETESDNSHIQISTNKHLVGNRLQIAFASNTVFATANRFRNTINPRAPPFSSI